MSNVTYTAKSSSFIISDHSPSLREYNVKVTSSRGTVRNVRITAGATTGAVIKSEVFTEAYRKTSNAPQGYIDAAIGHLGL